MTRKDFQLIADTLYDCRPESYHDDFGLWVHIAKTFAVNLSSTNERFDKDKFLLACGVKPND